MSGLVAIASSTPVSGDILSKATKTLVHRGPDALRTWISARKNVGFGHTRLAVIDLAAADQPLANEDELIHGIVDGRFYDYERTQRELVARGHRLRTRSDSEILVHLYEDHGINCLQQLRGEFAFVLWDERNQMLVAARDRFGIKPLYYARWGDTVLLASEAKAILGAGFPAVWDHDTFYQEIHNAEDPTRTLFKGIHQIPPGHYVVLRGGHFRLERYWDFDYPKSAGSPAIPDSEHVERLRAELNEAVRLRLRADVPVGIYLSGGIDSSCLLGMAAQHVSNPNAFTICFPESRIGNEEAVAKDSSARFGANLRCFYASKDSEADNLADAIYHWEGIPRKPVMVSKYLLSRFVRGCGVKAVLDGEGAGAIFSHFDEAPEDDMRLGADDAGVTQNPSSLSANGGLGVIRRVLGFVPSHVADLVSWLPIWRPLFSADFASDFSGRDLLLVHFSQLDVMGQLAGRERAATSQYIRQKTRLPAFFLSQAGDRSQMAHSIEGRVPFLDHHVVELVRDMPYSVKRRDGVDKYVLREAARPYVTEAVYRREKQPFPFGKSIDLVSGRLSTLLHDTLRGPALAAVPFFDQGRILDILDRRPTVSGKQSKLMDIVLFRVLGTCLLQEKYGLR
ncbi:MAG TPA: asparagine synthase (glutamine-hydrolyzing) [Burkholderiales bacterium]|nr:asparagine synthase (glutamine-hydrolyzing) [Burkholderiales bacterium]HTQ73855.1 asparagine synthase (glutamine-hydrolyzing) [Burkholderiales bacterium]